MSVSFEDIRVLIELFLCLVILGCALALIILGIRDLVRRLRK
jgi:hypothetical protein